MRAIFGFELKGSRQSFRACTEEAPVLMPMAQLGDLRLDFVNPKLAYDFQKGLAYSYGAHLRLLRLFKERDEPYYGKYVEKVAMTARK